MMSELRPQEQHAVDMMASLLDKASSDARPPACFDCMLAHSVIEVNEAADYSYDDRDEVQAAYAHLEGHDEE